MVKTIFADAIVRSLCTYFERKVIPTPDAITMWFTRVEKIPDEPVNWMVQKIKEQQEMFPRNLPNLLWEYYREWQQMNPDKMVSRGHICTADHCNGEGYVFATHSRDDGQRYEYVYRCPVCNQAREFTFSAFHRHDVTIGINPVPIIRAGKSIKSVKALTKMVLREDDDPAPPR